MNSRSYTVLSIISASVLTGLLTLTFESPRVGALDSPSTQWSRTYGGVDLDEAYSIVQTHEGGYALAGRTMSFGAGDSDIWLVKTDSEGNLEWSHAYGGEYEDEADCLIQTDDGGYVLAGFKSFPSGDSDLWLAKVDANGNTLWNKGYGGTNYEIAYSVTQTSEGGFAIAGDTESYGAGCSDFWLVKTDSMGNMEWSRTYGGADWDIAYSVAQTNDGGYAIAGSTRSFGGGNCDAWLVKTDSNGNVQWSETYGSADLEEAYSVVVTADGGYALAGSAVEGREFWLVKANSAGSLQWSRTYGGVGTDIAKGLVQTPDGGYALAGYSDSFDAGDWDWDLWLVKVDTIGNMQWDITHGGEDNDWAFSFVQTSDGGYALAGDTMSSGAGNGDFWLVKVGQETPPPPPPPLPEFPLGSGMPIAVMPLLLYLWWRRKLKTPQ